MTNNISHMMMHPGHMTCLYNCSHENTTYIIQEIFDNYFDEISFQKEYHYRLILNNSGFPTLKIFQGTVAIHIM